MERYYIVAIPREGAEYEWIATFETVEAAEDFAMRFADSIVICGVEI